MNLNMTTASRYGLNVLALLGLSVAFYLGSSIFIPLVLSAMLATILYPVSRWLHGRLRFPWFLACLLSVMMFVLLALITFFAVAANIPQLVNKLPADRAGWDQKYTETAKKLAKVVPFPINDVLPPKPENSSFYLSVTKLAAPENLSGYLSTIGKYGLEQLMSLVLILFVTLFLLLEGQMLAQKARTIFGPTTEAQARVTAALAEMAEAIQTYLVWRTIVNMGLAVVLGVVYKYVFELEQWSLWAVLTAVASYVPYIGTIAAGLPPVLDALISGRPDAAVGIMLFYTIVVTIEGYLIVPWVMGRSMDLNATTVMLACLYWHLVWGVAGLFLAMPLMAAIKAVCMHVQEWNAWGQLMSSGEPIPPPPEPPEMPAPTGTTDASKLLEGLTAGKPQ